jgi:hypothetical protein
VPRPVVVELLDGIVLLLIIDADAWHTLVLLAKIRVYRGKAGSIGNLRSGECPRVFPIALAIRESALSDGAVGVDVEDRPVGMVLRDNCGKRRVAACGEEGGPAIAFMPSFLCIPGDFVDLEILRLEIKPDKSWIELKTQFDCWKNSGTKPFRT